jgi:hypothetical protein
MLRVDTRSRHALFVSCTIYIVAPGGDLMFFLSKLSESVHARGRHAQPGFSEI